MISKIIASGQSGAERAALHWAIDNGIPIGGWCPQGRLADDGPIDPAFPLTETPTADPLQALEWNVRDSAGTAIFTSGKEITGVSLQTVQFIRTLGRPVVHVVDTEREIQKLAKALNNAIQGHRVYALHVTGPRCSEERAVYDFVYRLLAMAFGPPAGPRSRLDFRVHRKSEQPYYRDGRLIGNYLKDEISDLVLDEPSKQQILRISKLNWIEICDALYRDEARLGYLLSDRLSRQHWIVFYDDGDHTRYMLGGGGVMILERGTGKIIYKGAEIG